MLEQLFFISNYPTLEQNYGIWQKLLSVIKIYLLIFVAIFFSAPIFLLVDKLVVNILHHKSLVHQNKQMFEHIFQRLGFVRSFIFICIIGPAFEETIFRLLLSFKKQHIVISLTIALFYFGSSIFHIKNTMLKIYIELAIAAIVITLSLIFIPNTSFDFSPIIKKRLIVLSIILFGLMHVFNYLPFDYPLLWLYPVYVIPQLLMGWGLTYARFKNGFFWGILLHMIINTVSVLLSYHK